MRNDLVEIRETFMELAFLLDEIILLEIKEEMGVEVPKKEIEKLMANYIMKLVSLNMI